MNNKRNKPNILMIVTAITIVAMVLGACASPTQVSPTQVSPTEISPTSTPVVIPTNTMVVPTFVATVPKEELDLPGKLLICSDMPAPPLEFYDEQGSLLGSDVDIGNEIAARLGLQPEWINSVFDTIIAAVNYGKCDIVIAFSMINPSRTEQVDMIPYNSGGNGFLVKKGNPAGITTDPMSVCGKRLATEIGTTGAADAKAWSEKCVKEGKLPIEIYVATKAVTALQQIQTDRTDVFYYDGVVVGYYVVQQPDIFEKVPGAVEGNIITKGIMLAKNKPNLNAAIRAAIKSMQGDGTYMQILKKWGQGDTWVPPLDWQYGDPAGK